MGDRGKFAGGDQTYLREVQYADSARLVARANLHVKYGRGGWFPWWAAQVPWPDRSPLAVFEAGCGAGWLWGEATAEIPAGVTLTLTDLSPGMVDEAVARARGTGHYGSVTGETVDVQELPFADGSFDVVVANHMLYHVPDPRKGVAELARVLRPDGVAAIATNGRDHLRQLWDVSMTVFPTAQAVDETDEVFGLDIGEVILREHFASVELRRRPDVLRCTDPADVVAFITSYPPGDAATPAELERLHAEVARRCDEGGGVFEVAKEVGLFLCRPG